MPFFNNSLKVYFLEGEIAVPFCFNSLFKRRHDDHRDVECSPFFFHRNFMKRGVNLKTAKPKQSSGNASFLLYIKSIRWGGWE